MDSGGRTQLVTKDGEPATAGSVAWDSNLWSLKIYLTGRLRIESTDKVIDERGLYGSQARIIFALLVLERSRSVHRDELADALWPRGLPPRTWEAALRGVISKVRAFLTVAGLPAGSALFTSSGSYQLNLPSDVLVDIEYARSAAEVAEKFLREGDPACAVRIAESARAVAARPFLPDAGGLWIDSIRDRLREVLLWALCILSESYAQQRKYQLAVSAAEAVIALTPFRERTYQLLMRAHAAAGNPAEALLVYDRCRRLLVEELGVQPAAETAALHLSLLRNVNE